VSERWIKAAFIRGGTSKGVFFRAGDLPAGRGDIEPILLSALGSPDPYSRQIDGMGGGISSLSKAAIVGPASRSDADVDYTFAQVSVDRAVVEWGSNCGNLSSAAGPFAIDEGMLQRPDGEATIRIHQVNTGKIILARFAVERGRARAEGDFAIAGVAGTGARIALDILDPGGSTTGAFLPTGRAVETLQAGHAFPVSLVDAAIPVVFVAASDLGLNGHEAPGTIEADGALMARLDVLRRAGGVVMGIASAPDLVPLSIPKIALVAVPTAYRGLDGAAFAASSHDIAVRMLSMERVHKASPLTGAMCLAAACRVEDSVPHHLCRPVAPERDIRIATPSGIIPVNARVDRRGDRWRVGSASVYRTTRRLMQGEVAVRT